MRLASSARRADVADGFRAARELPKTQTKTRRPGSRRGWDWARRKGMGKEAIQHCESYSRRAEIRMGEMLAATERAKGTKALDAERKMGTMLVEKPPAIRWKPGPGRGKKASTSDALGFYVKQICESDNTPTLAELGLTWRESAEAQTLAKMSQEVFETIREGRKSKTQVRREAKAEEIKKKVSLPDAKYRVLYADPPVIAFEGRSSAGACVARVPACPGRSCEATARRQKYAKLKLGKKK